MLSIFKLIYSLNLLALSYFDLRDKKVPLAFVISLIILNPLMEIEWIFLFIIALCSILLYFCRLIKLADVFVLTSAFTAINIDQIKLFSNLLNIFSILFQTITILRSGRELIEASKTRSITSFYSRLRKKGFPLIPPIFLAWTVIQLNFYFKFL